MLWVNHVIVLWSKINTLWWRSHHEVNLCLCSASSNSIYVRQPSNIWQGEGLRWGWVGIGGGVHWEEEREKRFFWLTSETGRDLFKVFLAMIWKCSYKKPCVWCTASAGFLCWKHLVLWGYSITYISFNEPDVTYMADWALKCSSLPTSWTSLIVLSRHKSTVSEWHLYFWWEITLSKYLVGMNRLDMMGRKSSVFAWKSELGSERKLEKFSQMEASLHESTRNNVQFTGASRYSKYPCNPRTLDSSSNNFAFFTIF